jgi:hypothetical protein
MAFTLEEDFLQDLGESLEIFYNLQEFLMLGRKRQMISCIILRNIRKEGES